MPTPIGGSVVRYNIVLFYKLAVYNINNLSIQTSTEIFASNQTQTRQLYNISIDFVTH